MRKYPLDHDFVKQKWPYLFSATIFIVHSNVLTKFIPFRLHSAYYLASQRSPFSKFNKLRKKSLHSVYILFLRWEMAKANTDVYWQQQKVAVVLRNALMDPTRKLGSPPYFFTLCSSRWWWFGSSSPVQRGLHLWTLPVAVEWQRREVIPSTLFLGISIYALLPWDLTKYMLGFTISKSDFIVTRSL